MEEQRVCSMCGCILGENEGTELDDDLLCNDCVEQHTVQCDHCGETVWVEDSVSDERTVLCCSCFDDHYRRCEDCGRILHDSDVLWHNDYAYCEHCYDRIDTEIEEYGYKPEPVFYGEGNRFFGVELEIDLAGKDEENAYQIKKLANTQCEHIYCKYDGSLDDGFEIVTHPMTLDYHMDQMPWDAILQRAISLHYKSHMTSTCGLHVHINRTAFGENRDEQEQVIERLLFFVELHWNELFIFSRRSPHSMDRWAARYGMEKTGKLIMDKAKKGNTGRYAAINLCPYHTVEFRLFRGTLRLNTLLATLQLVNRIRNHLLPRRHYDLGFSLENIIFFELLRRGFKVSVGKIDSAEVDFIAQKNGRLHYYQVTASLTDENTFNREITPLKSLADNYPKTILTLDRFSLGDYEGIEVINAVDWLLEKE